MSEDVRPFQSTGTHQSPAPICRRTLLGGLAAGSLFPAAALADPGNALLLVRAARRQVGVTNNYNPRYARLSFPNGDVPREFGVCTDVLIRAYRDAFGVDLQSLVNADMRAVFAAYPRLWGLRRPDPNIDHRRVPNLQKYFARKGARLAIPNLLHQWKAGDIFTSLIDGRLPHTGLISDKRTSSGIPLVIHNIGAGAREEDALGDHPITGRYRFRLD